MTSVVISERFGGFGLSEAGAARLRALGFEEATRYVAPDRDDPRLVQVVRELGEQAGTSHANLVVIDIPDGIEWHIHEYDGYETLHETHRSWQSDGEEQDC